MLHRTKTFFKTTCLGGIIVILPTIILIFAFKWLFGFVGHGIKPLTRLVVGNLTLPDRYDRLIATFIGLLVIMLTCFFIGLFVKTRIGRWVYGGFENSLLSKAPGYTMVKETVTHLLGKKESPFSSVALVQIFENDTKVTAFITDKHEDGTITVFVPTGPNPTSGFIYHLDQRYVHPIDVSVEEAIRSVISCGAGSASLIKKFKKASDPTISGGQDSDVDERDSQPGQIVL